MSNLIKCTECGGEVSRTAKACPHCGANMDIQVASNTGDGFFYTFAVVWLFVGILGIHRLMIWNRQNIIIGLIQMFTLGGLTIWWMIDGFLIFTGKFKDVENREIKPPYSK